MKGFKSSMRDMKRQGERAAKDIQKSFTNVGRSMKQFGASMTRRITLPLITGAGLAVKAFSDFDDKMTQSTAIMSGVNAQLRSEMEATARQLSTELTISANDAAQSYFYLASAGLDAKQSMAALPQVAKFAQAGMFDMSVATDLATDAQSALGLTVDDAAKNLQNLTRVTDVLVKANTLANATVEQFSQALTREAGAALKSFGKDIEEGVAVLAAYADQGVKAELAGRGLSRIIRLITKAATDNEKEMKRLGIRVFDSSGAMRNMADIIGDLEKALGGMSDQQRTAALDSIGFEARMQGMILPIIGTSDAIREYEKQLRNAGGTTSDVADKQLKSFSSQMKILKNVVVNSAAEIGQSIVDAFDLRGLISDLKSNIQTGISWFNSLSDETKRMAFYVAGLLGAAGPVVASLGVLSVALGAISAPITATVAAVAVGATALIKNWSSVEEYFTTGGGAQMWDDLKEIVSSTIDIITDIWDSWGDTIIAITSETFKAIIKIVEFSLGRINEVMKKFNGEYNTELDIWEDNILTTISKIDGIITSSVWYAVMRSGEAFSNVFGGEDIEGPNMDDWLAVEKFIQDSLFFSQKWTFPEFDSSSLDNARNNAEGGADGLNNFADAAYNMRSALQRGMGDMDAPTPTIFDPSQLEQSQIMFMSLNDIVSQAGENASQIYGSKLPEAIQRTNIAAMNAANTLGNAFSRAAFEGEKLVNVVKDLAKQLAKRAFITGLSFLLPGGPAIGSTGFFSEMFGGMFHGGGMVPGTGDRMIRAKGGEMVLTKSQQSALGGMISQPSSSISESSIERAFSKAFGKHMSKMGPKEFFVLAQDGKRRFRK